KDGRPVSLNPRIFTVSAKLNSTELDFVLDRVRSSGLSRSEAFRLLLLHEQLPQVIHKGIDVNASAAYQNLQPLQSNLNQIAHALNSKAFEHFPPEAIEGLLKLI